MATGSARDLLAILRQGRKGAWTNDPNDPNYNNHWYNKGIRPDEHISQVLPGAATINGRRTPVTLRIATDATGQKIYYVDTPSIEAVGPIGRLAQRSAQHHGLSQPLRIDASAGVVSQPDPRRIQINAAQVSIRARTDGFVGRPSTLSPREQLRQAWRFAKG